MEIAKVVASRGTCDRKYIGAVIVNSANQILTTGYNGSQPGQPHCSEVGHQMENGHCIRTIHAEENAILQAARNGTKIDGATLYTTASPCWDCSQQIIRAGIKRIVFGELYRDIRIKESATANKIELVDFGKYSYEKLWLKN